MTPQEFQIIFDDYRMLICNYCTKVVGNRSEAEDITSEVFINFWKKKDNIRIGSIKAYLMISANNKCLDLLKMKKRNEKKIIDFSNQELEIIEIETEVLKKVYELFKLLTPAQHKIIRLRYIDGIETKNIAPMLGLTQQNVSNILYGALTRLRKEIKSRGIDYHG